MSRMTDMETIAPARGVAEQQEAYRIAKEEQQRIRQEKIDAMQAEEEAGLAEGRTNLAIDVLVRQKMEQKIAE